MIFRVLTVLIALMSGFFPICKAGADVLIVDAETSLLFDQGGLSSGDISTGTGSAGDFQIIACGIDIDGPNSFNFPSPGAWNEIANNECSEFSCHLGVWWRFVNSSDMENITCGAVSPFSAFTAVSMRYKNVETTDPIIDMACTFRDGDNLVLPPVASEPGAQIVRIDTLTFPGGETAEDVIFDARNTTAGAAVRFDTTTLATGIASNFDRRGEGEPGFSIPVVIVGIDQETCVLTLRMTPGSVTPIPTLSEWGLAAFALLPGMAGLYFLRKRRLSV